MLVLVSTVILYVAGFVFLYGVIRLAVRHALEDLEARRPGLLRSQEVAAAQDRTFVRENPFVANG
ncbi:hypothetical protein ABUL04_29580 [Micromonospora harpali]|jgi:hypothetical protein|uniref:Uncharacterized protein n=3 Tax=Micromonospora TaxID=1873 RepID=A0A1C4UHA8_9ACTN|nr:MULTISPECIES: hypothetical protein [Micromonospora]MDI5937559.1 hypothetical protein [Micromonospora sp. DH15]MBB5829782.1 hypothetical protein [Micromonospora carbonacea]MDG4816302.1 hypothetical protein [Micromonospora sp. WMMD956]OON33139.1 hypothetical protein BSA16_01875 [Micromonospora sp. Rc5]QLD22839.1 hypothetical protein HXZ27_00105 [Micromonospora carbonacea]